MRHPHLLCAVLLFGGAIFVQPWVSTDPVIHMLVQFPLLGAAGFVLGRKVQRARLWAGPILVLGIVTLLFWMLPRSLDGAITSWTMHIAKFTTLPLASGLPLAIAWPHVHRIVRGFLKAEAISMLGVLGFLYTHAPVRICNSYLISDQIQLGIGFFWLAAVLAVLWSLPAFLGPSFKWQWRNTRTILNDLR